MRYAGVKSRAEGDIQRVCWVPAGCLARATIDDEQQGKPWHAFFVLAYVHEGCDCAANVVILAPPIILAYEIDT